MERHWEIANARAVRDYEKDIVAIVKHGVADSILGEQQSRTSTPRTSSSKKDSKKESTPIAKNRQNKVTELLREKISELEMLTSEKKKNDAEISTLREKCRRLEKTLQLAQTVDTTSATKGGSPIKVTHATSKRVELLLQKWNDLGVRNHHGLISFVHIYMYVVLMYVMFFRCSCGRLIKRRKIRF